VPPNGEDWPRFHARVADAFAFIVSRRRAVNGTLVVVTHGLVCRALVERHWYPKASPFRRLSTTRA
jgi:broad specificity phosphatase PhoE